MNRRQFLRTGLLVGVGTFAAPMVNRGRFSVFADDRVPHSKQYAKRTLDLVGASNVIDMLGLLTLDWKRLYQWQRDPARFGEADFHKLRASGVNVFHPAVDPNHADPYAAVRGWISGWNRLLAAQPQYLLRIDSAADLERAHGEGKVGVLIGFQNSDHFRTSADVPFFHGIGQRVSQLTYNERNRIGTGCKEPRDTGLSQYGAEIVQAMNEVGMAIDVSHCSERTTLDAVRVSKRPVLITHSNSRALSAHPRCKSDTEIRAVAERGGVMGITFIPAFLCNGRPATLADVLDHIDHVVRLAGIDHVGLGSDSDLDAIDPKTNQVRSRYRIAGLSNAQRVFDLVEGLIRRGYSDAQIALILGGNFQRALGEIWKPAVLESPAALSSAAGG